MGSPSAQAIAPEFDGSGAALYEAPGGFTTNDVNMTKLESYLAGGNIFAAQFYAD